MNTPNPSEARAIATALQTFFDAEDELKAALDDMPKPASGWDHSTEQRATWQQKARRARAYQYRAEALTNLRKAAAFLTRPTSTPPDAWQTIESVELGKMVLVWHAGWVHSYPGQVICRDTGEVVLATPTPEHQQCNRYFASHWMPLPEPPK